MFRSWTTALIAAASLASCVEEASAQYYRRWAFAPRVECEAHPVEGILLRFTAQPIEWNLPPGAQYRLVRTDNGVVQSFGPFAAESGTDSIDFLGYGISGDAWPLSFAERFETIVDGEVTYRSELSGSCDGYGVGRSSLHEEVTWYRRWAFAPAATCSTVTGGVRITLANQPIEWVLPDEAQTQSVQIENGVVSVAGPFPTEGAGQGSITYANFANNFDAYPFTFVFRLETLVDGDVVYTSTLSAECGADGPTPVALVNAAPEPGGVALSGAALATAGCLARRRSRAS